MKILLKLSLAMLALAMMTLAPAAASADHLPEVTEFWLIDADADVRIELLDDYSSLRLPMLPSNLSIEAVANGDTESVLMKIDHVASSTENLEPYALRGDNSGDFNPAPELRVPGWVTVSAQPFDGADNTGVAGSEAVLHLYLHQPDFVVRSPLDIGDSNPGDGYCSIGWVPTVIDDFAIVPVSELPQAAQKLRPQVPEISDALKSSRAQNLLPTIEVDDKNSSKLTVETAAENNSLALAQIDDLSATNSKLSTELPKLRLAKISDPIDDQFRRAEKGNQSGERAKALPRENTDEAALPFGATAVDAQYRLQLGSGYRFDVGIPLDWYIPDWYPLVGCTLRAAIEEANALPGRQSVLIDSSKGPFELTKGMLTINDGIDLIGYGQRALIDAGDRSSIFYVTDDHIVNMRSLDLARGQAGISRGGAMFIDNDALVQMSDSIVRESQGNFGGGIYLQNGGDLTLTSSAIRDNIAGTPEDGIDGGGITQRGGGIFNLKGNVTIRRSAIFDNLAVRGGGLSNFGGTLRVENSSVIDNEALAIAGGIENHHTPERRGNLHLSFATVAHNQAGTSFNPPDSHRVGGGLYNTGWAYMASSILAANTDGWSAGDPLHAPDCFSPDEYDFKSYRNNVVGVLNGNCDLGDYSWGSTAGIEHGTEASPLDAGLLSKMIWDHRHYRMIGTSSPAVDGGASQSASLYPCPDTDSRGRTRPVGAGCDIGSVERQ